MVQRFFKQHQRWISALCCSTFFIVMHLWGAFERLENLTWSMRVNTFLDPSQASEEIVIIALDQDSLDWGEEQQGWAWPWPRSIYGHIIDYLQEHQAASIVLDLLFTESAPYPGEDERLADMIQGPSPVYSALPLQHELGSGEDKWPEHIEPFGIPHVSEQRHRAIFPIDAIASAVTGLGDVMGEVNLEKEIRSIRPLRHFDGIMVPLLGLAPLLTPSTSMEALAPFWRQEECILNFRGPSGTYPQIAFAALLEDIMRGKSGEDVRLDPSYFHGKHVIIGFSAPGLKDLRKTPVDHIFLGAEVHATALDNALKGDFISRSHELWTALQMLLLTSIIFYALNIKAFKWRVVVLVLCGASPPTLSFLAYPLTIWLPLASPVCCVLTAIAIHMLIAMVTEGRQKRFIKQAFSYYLSKDVIQQVLENPDQLKLGGERKELTILFSDLAKFSSISENMDPVQLTQLLNDYLSEMTDIILSEQGTLDKFEGDAIMALWNAPLDVKDHPLRACRAAVRCQQKLDERSEYYQEHYGVTLKARIGVHTGVVVVGNMGSRTRFDYTVLGDAANLASRLEGANKAFDSSIMISETTWLRCKDDLPCRTIAPITVLGRETPLWTYEPLWQKHDHLSAWKHWEAAMSHHREGEFKAAQEQLEQCDDSTPAKEKWLTQWKIQDWDGIFRLDSK